MKIFFGLMITAILYLIWSWHVFSRRRNTYEDEDYTPYARRNRRDPTLDVKPPVNEVTGYSEVNQPYSGYDPNSAIDRYKHF